jgi:hypothetical protein
MKYAAEMSSGAMIYIPNFIKIGSGIQKLMGGGEEITDIQHDDLKSPLSCFRNKESRLKRKFIDKHRMFCHSVGSFNMSNFECSCTSKFG